MHPPQFAESGGAFQNPRQLGVLGNVALHEQHADLGVEARCHQQLREAQCGGLQFGGILRHGDGVQVHDRVKRLVRVLVGHPVPQGTQQVAQVHVATRLNPRQNTPHPKRLATATRNDPPHRCDPISRHLGTGAPPVIPAEAGTYACQCGGWQHRLGWLTDPCLTVGWWHCSAWLLAGVPVR